MIAAGTELVFIGDPQTKLALKSVQGDFVSMGIQRIVKRPRIDGNQGNETLVTRFAPAVGLVGGEAIGATIDLVLLPAGGLFGVLSAELTA